MLEAESSTATTRNGASCATRTSTNTSSSSLRALPALRDRVAADMRLEGLPREKVLATIVSLLEKTLIRVGNAEYAEKNKSYGLTTMRRKHVAVGRGVLRFDFTGKSGKQWKLRVEDKRITAIVKRCAEIPGHELFQYLDDDGQPRTVDSGDVNAYIKDITGEDFSAAISAPGRGRFWRRWRCPSSRSTTATPRRSATSSPRSRASQSSSATRPPSAASATCTRKS